MIRDRSLRAETRSASGRVSQWLKVEAAFVRRTPASAGAGSSVRQAALESDLFARRSRLPRCLLLDFVATATVLLAVQKTHPQSLSTDWLSHLPRGTMIKFHLSPPPGCAGSFRKETEFHVSHKGGDHVAEESPVSEPWAAPSEAAILLEIESLDSGRTVLSRPGKGPSHTSETSLVPSRERL